MLSNAKNTYSCMIHPVIKRLYVLPLCLFSFKGISQEVSSESEKIKEVNTLVIGAKPKTEAAVKDTASKVKQAPFPGSIEVEDTRDHVVFNIIPASDEVIAERIKGLENIMPMPYNEHVKKYIDYFLYKRPNFVKQMLERKEFYFPVFEKYLVKHNIPDEMKYLALLESGLNPNAVSRANAVGMWQFMSYTGKEYGLKINEYVDERRHVEKSTDASFRYLTRLYNQFDDWELALASYNTGPGRIRRAIRKSGKTDYWSLHAYIHPDTRAYVPQWEALHYLMNYSAEHGIFPDYKEALYPMETENLVMDGPLNLKSFAELNYLDFATLKLLNPHIITDELPTYARDVEVKLPRVNYVYFENNKKCVLDSAMILKSGAQETYVAQSDSKGDYHIEYKDSKHYHRVVSGDYLGKIAEKYDVRISDLKRWNNLRSNTVMKGQRLVYYKREAHKVYDAINDSKEKTQVASAKTSETKSNENAASLSNVKVVAKNNTTVPAEKPFHYEKQTVKRYHFIQRGENLTMIARKYDTTVKELMELNNIQSQNKIMRGQRLAYYTTISEKVYDQSSSDANKNLIVHVVQPGDTLWNLSQRYGFSISEIKKLNGLDDNTLKVGQKIKVKG